MAKARTPSMARTRQPNQRQLLLVHQAALRYSQGRGGAKTLRRLQEAGVNPDVLKRKANASRLAGFDAAQKSLGQRPGPGPDSTPQTDWDARKHNLDQQGGMIFAYLLKRGAIKKSGPLGGLLKKPKVNVNQTLNAEQRAAKERALARRRNRVQARQT